MYILSIIIVILLYSTYILRLSGATFFVFAIGNILTFEQRFYSKEINRISERMMLPTHTR